MAFADYHESKAGGRMIDGLVSTALLGTRTGALRLSTLPNELTAVLPSESSGHDGDVESRLLDAAAAITVYARAGRKPRSDVAMQAASAADHWTECSRTAADLLAQILDEGWETLVVEWLMLAAAANHRPPYRMLPSLLDAAAARPALRAPVSTVMGERGHWLVHFNPRWQFSSAQGESPVGVWHTGAREQRSAALRTIRGEDPTKARELIAATWKEDSAELRTEWITCLTEGLSNHDEAFLETCLDDRSARVRAAAAELLTRLPESQFVGRMIDRAACFVAFELGIAGSMLKLSRGKPASWRVTLPESFDKAMQRDGMTEKPAASFGPKQWQLAQVIACVPLEHWTNTYGASAVDLVAAAEGDFAAVFRHGWLAALGRIPVIDWLGPLLESAGENVSLSRSVLDAVPASKRCEMLAAVCRVAGRPAAGLADVLASWRPLDEPVSKALLHRYELPAILFSDAYLYLHPNVLEQLETLVARWDKTPDHQRRVDHVLAVVAMRRNLHKEFAR